MLTVAAICSRVTHSKILTRIRSPIVMAFFLPILSRYFPISGENINDDNSNALIILQSIVLP